jgi:hypothetical protein
MKDIFFLNIKVLVAKVLKKKGTSDMIPDICVKQKKASKRPFFVGLRPFGQA